MKNPSITLQQLVNQKIRKKGLSRLQLVSALGYTNISKGCRRLDTYLTSLHPPSEEFLINFLAVLDINVLEFNKAVFCTESKANRAADRDAKERFHPHMILLVKMDISPLFVRGILYNKYCTQRFPEHIQTLPFNEEIEFVVSAYRERYDNFISNIGQRMASQCVDRGFRYYRHYDSYLDFNADGALVSIRAVEPAPEVKQPLGNRVINMLSGGAI